MILIPIGDDNSGRRTFPVVSVVFIVLNVLVFVLGQRLGEDIKFTYAFAAVPAEITTLRDIVSGEEPVVNPRTREVVGMRPGLQVTPIPVLLTLVTSMFMHGNFAHIMGNMLYLWIFGDNVEDDLGRVRFTVFYLACGVLAALSHVFLSPNSQVPMLGASGAISGVLAGYLLLHPQRRVRVILVRIVTEVPAILAIGAWFVFQVVNGLGMFGGSAEEAGGGGVAYAAHIGGFVAGLILAPVFRLGLPPIAPYASRRYY